MKKILIIINTLLVFSIYRWHQHQVEVDYEVYQKKRANLSVICPELYPEEKLKIKINNINILTMGNNTMSHSFWKYFYFPDNINVIEVNMYYRDKRKFYKIFRDTLDYAKRRSIIISRTFPKGMTKQTYRPYGFVPMDSAERKITLVDDSVHFKGMRLY